MERLQRRQAPWLPIALLSTDRFDSEERIRQVREPVLVAHCAGDRVIPIAEGRRLYSGARAGAGFLAVQGCGHIGTWADEGTRRQMLDALRVFTRTAPASPPA